MRIFGIVATKEEAVQEAQEHFTQAEREFSLRCTCLTAPYQFEGFYKGYVLYLRSQHGKTHCDIYEQGPNIPAPDGRRYIVRADMELDISTPDVAVSFILLAIQDSGI